MKGFSAAATAVAGAALLIKSAYADVDPIVIIVRPSLSDVTQTKAIVLISSTLGLQVLLPDQWYTIVSTSCLRSRTALI